MDDDEVKRSRSRSPKRGGEPGQKKSRERDRSRGSEKPSDIRVYVANVPYDVQWQDLKDLFRDKVGEVAFVDLFEDETGKPRGCGIVEFKQAGLTEKAIELLHKHEINGRKIVVKEDYNRERDSTGRLVGARREGRPGGGEGGRERGPPRPGPGMGGDRRGGDRRMDGGRMGGGRMGGMRGGGGGDMGGGGRMGGMNDGGGMGQGSFGNTYGLSPQFLDSLGIDGPLTNKIFVANLDYDISEKKLRDVFRMAGHIVHVELQIDDNGKSRGFGNIEFEHPVEAVQAISMFNGQMLYDRPMGVRMDRRDTPSGSIPRRLPSGLKGVGLGLGLGGNPLNNLSALKGIPSEGNGVGMGMGGGGDVGLVSGMGGMGGMSSGLGLGAASLMGSGSLGYGGMESALASTGMVGSLGSAMGSLNGGLTASSYRGGSSLVDNYGYMDRSTRISDTICIRNLPQTINWQLLIDRFRDVGDVKAAERSKDAAMIRFATERDAQRALNLVDGVRLDGKLIEAYFQ